MEARCRFLAWYFEESGNRWSDARTPVAIMDVGPLGLAAAANLAKGGTYSTPTTWAAEVGRTGGSLSEGLDLRFVANHFDVVPVRTNHESCIVVRVVVRTQTRRTIIFATRLQSRAMESFDLLAILDRERQVKMRRLLLGLEQAQ